jgi:hypothetical protein
LHEFFGRGEVGWGDICQAKKGKLLLRLLLFRDGSRQAKEKDFLTKLSTFNKILDQQKDCRTKKNSTVDEKKNFMRPYHMCTFDVLK